MSDTILFEVDVDEGIDLSDLQEVVVFDKDGQRTVQVEVRKEDNKQVVYVK